MKKAGFGAFEMIISVLVILTLIYLFVPKYQEVIYESKVVTRDKEVREFQSVIIYYHLKNKKLPLTLKTLVDEGYIELKKDFEEDRVSGDDILDPFGRAYIYDNKSGELSFFEEK